MSVLKCKICGGTLELTGDASVCVCQYCGTKQTLPKLSGEHSSTLYERADHFRRNNDFDKAISVYEQILNEDPSDAEAYWSLVLCRYGVEYVEDPKSNKRIATVNRMQYTSVLSDEDYKAALRHADPEQKTIYEAEAHEIDTIQKGILAISQKEEPFDVFICYKETDANGRRTQDSVLANELYHQLTNEGFKVFFSRITLEDKLGSAYEPYIFAALNSAKVMVVLGTKPDYFNAVWVRNEWSRFLALIKNGANKVLIPAYRDMDPYDLPEEFSHLQAQDMSKLGFMQDLIRGIEKLAGTAKPAPAPVAVPVQNTASTDPLLRRLFLFLEDGKWESADEYCEKVLDQNPECGEAYLGKLMIALRVRRREQLAEQTQPFDSHPDYEKALRFGDEALKQELTGAVAAVRNRAERERLLGLYRKAEALAAAAKTKEAFLTAAAAFEAIVGFEDAAARAEACRRQADDVYFGGLYASAAALLNNAKTAEDYQKAAAAFRAVGAYKDAETLAAVCDDKAAVAEKDTVYTTAVALMAGGKLKNYKKAAAALETIRGFRDADIKIDDCERHIGEIQAAASVSLAAKEKRAAERKENFKKQLPLIRKVAMVVVPLLIIGVLAAMILPTIDFAALTTSDPTTTTVAGGKVTTTVTGGTTATTKFTTQATTVVTTVVTEETGRPTGNGTTRPRPTSKPTTPPADVSGDPMVASHAADCPLADGVYPNLTFNGSATLVWCSLNDSVTHDVLCHRMWVQGSEGYCLLYVEYTHGEPRLIRKTEDYYPNNDENANPSKSISFHYHENGAVQYEIRAEYYASGTSKLDVWREYDKNGAFVVERRDEYYSSGVKKLESQTNADSGKHTYEFNSAGVKVKETVYYGNGQLCTLCEYDDNGDQTKYLWYYEDGRVGENLTITYEYDSKGRKTKKIAYNSDGNPQEWSAYAYGNTIKESRYSSDNVLYQVWEYDTDWNTIRVTGYNQDGSVVWVENY